MSVAPGRPKQAPTAAREGEGATVGRWSLWHPRSGSLHRFLLGWLLGSVWLTVAVLSLVQFGAHYLRRADAQDAWLIGQLDPAAQRLAQQSAPDAPPLDARPAAADSLASATLRWRVTQLKGEPLTGDATWAPFPWPASLEPDGAPALYISHAEGSLLRAVAALRPVTIDGKPVTAMVQVALPWRARLPGWHALLDQSPLPWLYAYALLLSALVWLGVTIAGRWLDQARQALDAAADCGDDENCGPSELRPTVLHMRQLRRDQVHWVEQQRRFLADASHQLRTPMAVLRTQLQSAIAGDAAASVLLPQMLHTLDRAAGLANQLLSLTKLEQLKHNGGLQPVNLHAAARDAVVELSPLIAAKRLDFVLEGPELSADGDPVMLGELLRNLLANAIHHAPATGRMGVLLREGAGRVELLVWDEGPGVDNDVQARLFQPFSASVGGVGLGLSICKQIAEAMGASVDLYNRVSNGRVIGVDAVVAWAGAP